MKLFPEQRASLDEALAASLAPIPEGQERNNGAAVGLAAAGSLLAWCADDRVGLPTQYRPLTQPGKYVMTTLPVGDDFGASRPWLLTGPDQFRPGPPPALTSEAWARDINETRKIGAKAGKERTAEQTEVATFWIVTGAPSYNGIIRQAVANKKLSDAEAARVMALAFMAATDSLIAVFDAKYAYGFWRPITAVRRRPARQPRRRTRRGLAAAGGRAVAPRIPVRALHQLRRRGEGVADGWATTCR